MGRPPDWGVDVSYLVNGRREAKRSPLKHKPLRNPGESLQELRQNLVSEEFLPPLALAAASVFFAAYEWGRWYFNSPPHPRIITAFALFLVAYSAYQFIAIRKLRSNLRLGLEGEKTVGQYLEGLRAHGCHVYHDIIGEGFNIDHVVVSRRGIFVIETKTYSKRRPDATVQFDGERILVDGREPDRDPLVQLQALRDWLHDYLYESTGRGFHINAVVVFPGWWVEVHAKTKTDIRVMNHKQLEGFIEHEPMSLSSDDVALVSHRIMIHIQDYRGN